MIQLILDSAGKITPEWENEQERLIFRLAPVQVVLAGNLHRRIAEAGAPAPESEPLGLLTVRYEGESADQVRIILELPDEIWDALADRADAMLDQALQPD